MIVDDDAVISMAEGEVEELSRVISKDSINFGWKGMSSASRRRLASDKSSLA